MKTLKLCECNIRDKVQIYSGLKNGCYACGEESGFVVPLAKAIQLIDRGIHWVGWNINLHKTDEIGCIVNQEKQVVYVVNNDCFVKVLEERNSEKYVKEKVEDMKDFSFRIYDYKVYNNKALKVTFRDGFNKEHRLEEEKAVCNDEDTFDLMRGLEVCVLKHILGEDTYKQIIKEISKQIKAIEDEEKAKKEKEEMIAKKKAKNDVRMAKRRAKIQLLEDERKAKERQERIEEMKEAYLAAMIEYRTTDILDVDIEDLK